MTDRSDEPLSSEELIRRAREGFSAPSVDDERPSRRPDELEIAEAAPPAPEPIADEPPGPSFERYRREPDPVRTPPIEEEPKATVDDRPAPSPLIDDPIDPEPQVVDDDALLPEHFRPEAGAPAGGRSRPRVRVGWIVAAAVGGFALFSVITADTAVDDLTVGDCFLSPTADEFSTVETVDCSEPHEHEVIGYIGLDDRAGGFPSEFALYGEAYEKCRPLFIAYVGVGVDDTPYDHDAFFPTESSWDAGDREAMCTVVRFDADLNYLSSTGSARGG